MREHKPTDAAALAIVGCVRNDPQYATADYVMVADLDGVNNDLRREVVATGWASTVPWDVVAANRGDA